MSIPNMTLKEAIEVLKYHNEWRRGELELELDDATNYNQAMQCPKDIGNAIDLVVNRLTALCSDSFYEV